MTVRDAAPAPAPLVTLEAFCSIEDCVGDGGGRGGPSPPAEIAAEPAALLSVDAWVQEGAAAPPVGCCAVRSAEAQPRDECAAESASSGSHGGRPRSAPVARACEERRVGRPEVEAEAAPRSCGAAPRRSASAPRAGPRHEGAGAAPRPPPRPG